MNFFTLSHRTAELKIYSATVYCKAFQREINLSIAMFCRKDGTEICRKRYFSTDLPQDGMNIVRYYRARFQTEFLYRDARQHGGQVDCQAQSKNKLDFHFNTALTTVNPAKILRLENR